MKKIFLGLAMGVMLALLACTSTPNKANIAELTQKGEFIMLNGSKFTGTAIDEERMITLNIDNGEVKEIVACHDNGSVAMLSDKDGFSFFDPEGKQIDDRNYYQNYYNIQERIDQSLNQIKLEN